MINIGDVKTLLEIAYFVKFKQNDLMTNFSLRKKTIYQETKSCYICQIYLNNLNTINNNLNGKITKYFMTFKKPVSVYIYCRNCILLTNI